MASYQIEWKRSAQRELRKLPRPMIERVVVAVENLADDPHPRGVRKLANSDNTYRIRVGDYRIIYDIFEKKLIVEILHIRHRKDAYR
jgi:mRNA interferase RelE/StbE